MGLLIQGFNIIKEVFNRLIGVFDFVLCLIGIMPVKRLRLRIIVLRDERGIPVLAEHEAMRTFQDTSRILGRGARVEIVPAEWKVVTAPAAAPREALNVRCMDGAWSDDLGVAGSFYRSLQAQNFSGRLFGYAAPLTVFVVRSISDRDGCSLGALTDHVTVQADATKRSRALAAHELAHACGLFHTSDKANIMYPKNPGEQMSRWQAAIFRNSRHVTYL